MYYSLFCLEQLYLILLIFTGFYLLLTPKYPIKKYAVWTIPFALLSVICSVTDSFWLQLLCIFLDVAILACLCFLGFKDGMRQKGLVLAGEFLAVCLEFVIFGWLRANVLGFAVNLADIGKNPERGLFLQEISGIHLIVLILFWMFLKRKEIKSGMKQLIPVSFLPMSNICSLMSLEVCFDEKTKWFLFILVPASYFLLITVLLWLNWVYNADAREKVRQRLREESNQLELEQFHFEQIEKKREILNQICGGYRQELTEIQELLNQKQLNRAVEKTEDMVSNIQATRETPYSHIPVLNAILTEKEAECQKQQIRLVCDVQLYRTEINGLAVCSILGNLLDNAIRGTAEACAKNPQQEACILLSVKENDSKLFVRTENPSLPVPKRPRPNHGRGIKIVKEVSSRFGGEYFSEYKDGVYTAVVTMEL